MGRHNENDEQQLAGIRILFLGFPESGLFFSTEVYASALNAVCPQVEILVARTVDDALALLHDPTFIRVVIFEMVFEPGSLGSEVTQSGLLAGKEFYSKVREGLGNKTTYLFLLTRRNIEHLRSGDHLPPSGDPRALVMSVAEVLPEQLPGILLGVLFPKK